ncbi:NUDIX domain-containing protein [Halobacillus litoralis]|uniref:NUDIX hydrolase n=1 Tax=Halobacillus litoralis TaxID=45668 RepID=UPI001CD259B4|nr:NUDIX domain-containing protein [Halobacillus litoralis]MCA0969301.1 NUDIX domain-containing protein [Halobacillus litoralis]
MTQVEVPIRCTGVAAVLLKKSASGYQVLLLKRNTEVLRDVWCYVGGSIEEGETAWEAALREIEEETKITQLSLYSSNLFDQIYSPFENYIYIAPVFVGYVEELEEVTLNGEHSDFHWCSFDEAEDIVSLPGNGDVLRAVEKYFVQKDPMSDLHIYTSPT